MIRRRFSVSSAPLTLFAGALLAASCAISGSSIDPSLDSTSGAAGTLGGGANGGTAESGSSGDAGGPTPNGGKAGNHPGLSGAGGELVTAGGAGTGGISAGGTSMGGTGTGGTGTGGTGTGGTGTGGTRTSGGASGTGTGGVAGGGPVCPAGVTGHCDFADLSKYPSYVGYTLNLVEDFPAPIDLNTDPVWTWSDGYPSDSQTSFAEPNITFANGRMILKAASTCLPANNDFSCYPPRAYYAESFTDAYPRMLGGTGVVSGELRSKYNNFRYGRYEVKMKAPAQPTGNFLSTMFVFRSPSNAAWNEIDLELEANAQGKVNGNTINAPSGAKAYPAGNAAPWTLAVTGLAIAADHIYAFSWTPTAITWYLDNSTVPIHSYDGSGAVKIPALSAKIRMNLWVFASSVAFGDPTKNVYPMTSEYDYFRFYKWDTETTYPVAGHPTGADYLPSAQNNPKEQNYGQ